MVLALAAGTKKISVLSLKYDNLLEFPRTRTVITTSPVLLEEYVVTVCCTISISLGEASVMPSVIRVAKLVLEITEILTVRFWIYY